MKTTVNLDKIFCHVVIIIFQINIIFAVVASRSWCMSTFWLSVIGNTFDKEIFPLYISNVVSCKNNN